MRVAVFGAGRIGPMHARTLLGVPGLDHISITHVVQDRTVSAAAELGLGALRFLSGAEALDVCCLGTASGTRPGPCPARDGVEALRLVEALVISAREHRVVPLTEVPA